MRPRAGTILVVDDDRINRMLLASLLEEQGYAVETAEDGGQALVVLHAQPFDVVLLDLLMPEIDGYQVLEQMKSDSTLRHIPVIVISAVDEMESVIRCIEMGATDYLPKPFDPVLLRARVNASLANKRLHDLQQAYVQQIQRIGARLRAIFEGAAIGIGLIDLAGRFTESNPALERMLGYRGEELRSILFADLTHPDDAGASLALHQELVAGKRSHYQVEERHLRKDGRAIWVRLTASLIRDVEDKPQFGLRMVEDITERKQAQAQVLQQQQALAALEARQRITAAEERLRREIAELLHGPVQTKLLIAWIRLGECQTLLPADPLAASALLDEVRSELEQVREQEVRRASHLLHPSIIGVGLLPAVRTLVESFERHFQVSVQIEPGLVDLDQPLQNAIPELLRLAAYRVVEEALNNVARHAGAKAVGVSLGIDDQRCLTVAVEDNGRGFETTQLEPGLGLSSISGRVEQAGGSWEISSAPGRGTRLSVRLPIPADLSPAATMPVAV